MNKLLVEPSVFKFCILENILSHNWPAISTHDLINNENPGLVLLTELTGGKKLACWSLGELLVLSSGVLLFAFFYRNILHHINTHDAEKHSHYIDDDGTAGGDQHYVAIDLIVVAYNPLDG